MSEPNTPAAQVTAEPQAASANANAAQQRAGVTFLGALAIAVVCSAASGYASWRMATRSAQPSASIAVIDSERILKSKLEAVLGNPSLKPEEASAAARLFTEGLGRELSRYTDAGIVVVNSNVVVKRPDGLDITQEVAQALGVQLK